MVTSGIQTLQLERDAKQPERKERRRTCSLIITHQCNLNCRYCYESFKSKKAMPLDIAKEAVEREFATADDYEGVVVDFMGGEPLTQFELMREIAEWIWSNPWPKPYILSTSTNGTLFTSESKAWFRRNADRFSVGLSLDGTPEMQRTNRGCSFQDIDLEFFLTTWPEQEVKMTVSCETLSSLAEGIIHLQERGFKVHANLGYGIPWNDSHREVFSRQLKILGEYYLQHPDIPPVSLLDLKLAVVLNENHPVKKYCGTGTHMRFYDVDGTLYPCHMFTPLVLSRANRFGPHTRFQSHCPSGGSEMLRMLREGPLPDVLWVQLQAQRRSGNS